jgi:hypothetical protein
MNRKERYKCYAIEIGFALLIGTAKVVIIVGAIFLIDLFK